MVLRVLGVLVAAWLAFALVFFLWAPWAGPGPKHADVVVVLSGGRERLPPAMKLIREGVAPVLAISSVNRTRPWKLGHRLCDAGHYAGARVLCFDADPFSTQGEAETVSRIARAHRWTSVVVVTSRFHTTRARMLFKRCYAGRLSMVGVGSTWWKLPLDWISETGKLIVQLTVQRGC
ncbi:MAG: YdcF family protein [Actinomycetota bacterium]